MKTRSFFSAVAGLFLLTTIIGMTACSKAGDDSDDFATLNGSTGYKDAEGMAEGSDASPGGGGEGQNDNTKAGIITAGEWSDLTNWDFWAGLMQGGEHADKSKYWEFYTNNRVAIKVADKSGKALAGISVKLYRNEGDDEALLWEAVTDNHGLAECWVGLLQKEEADANKLTVSVDGKEMAGHPQLTNWDNADKTALNQYVCTTAKAATPKADIAFVVDATGSMSDEINFLKSDLADIIGKSASVRPDMALRTAALFYRDEGDEYVTRHSDFTSDVKKTASFVSWQEANGGGDYPEAVHTALDHMLQKLSWDNKATTRLAFLVLDAPAHHEDDVIRSLQQSITLCAKQGIRIIPVSASGVDKNTEFMLRFFAISTGGTYVFITNDSGVGSYHIEPTVGDYKVEQLNDLIVRLIKYYTE